MQPTDSVTVLAMGLGRPATLRTISERSGDGERIPSFLAVRVYPIINTDTLCVGCIGSAHCSLHRYYSYLKERAATISTHEIPVQTC